MNKLTGFDLLEEYARWNRAISIYEDYPKECPNLGMPAVASRLVTRKLLKEEVSKEEVVTTLRSEAKKRGALQRIYVPVDNTSPFAQGMTHQDIIDMIEQASEWTE